jgi:2,3-bisphosphoglycerate-independent phosphoglycerate mutase
MAQNKKNTPMILVILDGWGICPPNKGNAVTLAHTPTMNGLVKKYPNTKLHAHGKYAGLPSKQVGNSEAGHMNIGAGRLVEQDVVKISRAIDDGTFYKNSAFTGAMRHIRKMDSKIHVVGMVSDGQSPHSDPKHLKAILTFLRKNKVKEIFLHLFTDGRDSPQYASLKLMDDLENELRENEHIVTVMGRYYGMNRQKSWSKTEQAYNTLVYGEGRKADSVKAAITESYNRGDSDEFIEPYVVGEKAKDSRINDGDSVIFFNLRSDRARQLAKVFVQEDFNKMNPGSFKRKKRLEHLYFVAMTDFGPDLDDIITAYPGVDIKATLPMQLKDFSQLYIAESEKFAHVTYFLNGGYSGKVAGEDQEIIPSPDVRSYDETPAMSSERLAKSVIDNLSKGKNKKPKYEFTLLNFAAPDMVGHTGNLQAGIKSCEIIDRLLAKIVKAYLSANGTVIITADHGNIEEMINLETGEVDTKHSIYPVPFIVVNKNMRKTKLKTNGILGDVAPTVLRILGVKKPQEMKRKPLII